MRRPLLTGIGRGLACWPATAGVGAVTALAVWRVWGSLQQTPLYHDEEAYRLQAEIFASGRWSAPSPPLPEFFHQYHILVEPVLASKYFPGHSLLIAPGAWLGLPGLIPLLFSALAGALIFVLARRLSNPWVALVTWLLWLGGLHNLWWRASYFSETSTSLLWLFSCLLLLRYRERGRTLDLVALAGAAGWTAITRPLTAIALWLPIGVVVLHGAWQRRRLASLVPALAVGILVLGILPLWSWGTMGTVENSPWAEYTRQYIPWDGLGFGRGAGSPTQELPDDMRRFSDEFAALRSEHTLASLPGTVFIRLAAAVVSVGGGWRGVLVPLGIWSLIAGVRHRRFLCASWLALFLAYLLYAHPPRWTLYQMETLPIAAFFMAAGLWRLSVLAVSRTRHGGNSRKVLRFGMLLAAVAMAGLLPRDVHIARDEMKHQRSYHDRFALRLRNATSGRSGVFIRYSGDHPTRYNIVRITPDVRSAETVLARDRGAENVRLMRELPGRTWYLFEEKTGSLRRLDDAGSPSP